MCDYLSENKIKYIFCRAFSAFCGYGLIWDYGPIKLSYTSSCKHIQSPKRRKRFKRWWRQTLPHTGVRNVHIKSTIMIVYIYTSIILHCIALFYTICGRKFGVALARGFANSQTLVQHWQHIGRIGIVCPAGIDFKPLIIACVQN